MSTGCQGIKRKNASRTSGLVCLRHGGTGNDLVVRWSDGETTLYADTGTKAVGTEHTLVDPGT